MENHKIGEFSEYKFQKKYNFFSLITFRSLGVSSFLFLFTTLPLKLFELSDDSTFLLGIFSPEFELKFSRFPAFLISSIKSSTGSLPEGATTKIENKNVF